MTSETASTITLPLTTADGPIVFSHARKDLDHYQWLYGPRRRPELHFSTQPGEHRWGSYKRNWGLDLESTFGQTFSYHFRQLMAEKRISCLEIWGDSPERNR